MIINKITGERYKQQIVGSSLLLTSSSTGIKRLLHAKSPAKIFIEKESNLREPKVRPEANVVPDLVRSLQLEINYLECKGQKVHLKFR